MSGLDKECIAGLAQVLVAGSIWAATASTTGIGQAEALVGGAGLLGRLSERQPNAKRALDTFARNLTRNWEEWSRNASDRDEGRRQSAMAAFREVVPHCTLLPPTLVACRLDPDAVAARFLTRAQEVLPDLYGIPGKLPANEDIRSAHDFLTSLVGNAYRHLLAEPDYIDRIAPDLWRTLLDAAEENRQAHATTHAQNDAQTAMLRELLARTAPGLPLATAQEILRSFGEMVENPDPARVETLLKAKAEEYATLRARLGELDNSGDLVVRDLLRAARDLIETADFDAADAKMVEAEHHADLTRARVRASRADLALLRLNHRDAAAHFAAAAAIVPATDAATRWRYEERRCDALTTLGRDFGDNAALREAIRLYHDTVLPRAPRATAPETWAATQNNLGTALQTLGAREAGTARLEEAVAAYRAALEVRTRATVPLNWAATQNNLGIALQTLGEREAGTARLEAAVAAYLAALGVRTRETVPLDWAATQNNLGIALETLGAREAGTARLEEAVKAYRAALEVRTRATGPLDWARTQMNLGAALQTLGEREAGTARLDEAVKAYRAALEVQTRETVPLNWAMTQNNLGNALAALGEREGGTARLEEAVAAYRAALKEWTRETEPLDWAMTQNNLGTALRALGEREAGTARLRLEAAVKAFRASLEVWTRETVPLNWAATQNNLGTALQSLGAREAGTARLEAAVAAYRAALEVWTRETVPLNWAMSTGNQGLAMVILGDRTGDAGMIRAGIGQIRTAAEVLRAGGHLPHAADYEQQLPVAEAALARLTGR